MVISIFLNYQKQQISVYAQQVVKVSRRSDGGKSTKMSFKNVRYGAPKTVSKHLKVTTNLRGCLPEKKIRTRAVFLGNHHELYIIKKVIKCRIR